MISDPKSIVIRKRQGPTIAHRQEMEVAPTQVPATAQRKNDAPKRKAVEAEPGFEDGDHGQGWRTLETWLLVAG